MTLIDSHVHFWNPARLDYPWLDSVPDIKKPFLIHDYNQATSGYEVIKLVFVQSECEPEQALDELDFVMEQAAIDRRIAGIVAYAPLEQGEEVINYLNILKANPLVRGVRRLTENQTNPCTAAPFIEAARLLPRFGLTLDVSIRPYQMEETFALIERCPETQFILDHLGKPNIGHGQFYAFQKHIGRMAQFPNVVAKVSGLVTEADWEYWTKDEIQPYVDYALERFGADRLLFGSDWPVVLVAATFDRWLDTLQQLVTHCSESERESLFYRTAERVYQLAG
ncbi:amidohydrolase family protein [Persicitalea jodogahamensis]|uniref:Amidohydrolase n=1 Tax=Persicitalea jodogahamensis TaxID=402147 RepID=A0A8J3D830_9BACT|nr:amidohydrolase family protein [Persicitalea jodogahamensis]GHB86749.1 amidohydrolase [Persicitalea jodogahamensis]